MIDLARVRADTAGVSNVIHLNNCGSSLPPDVVVEAQIDYLRAEQHMGGYEAAEAYGDELDDFAIATAEMLGASPDEVAFQGSASEGWWRAFTSIPLAEGDAVIVGSSEFMANAFGLLQARERGIDVRVVPNGPTGTIDLEALDAAFDDRVRLVGLTYISMSNGAVHPAAAVGERCRARGVPYLLDACQAAGQMPLDVEDLSCDFLVYTGRKFMRGPRGTGVLYARQSVVDELGPTPFVDGRSAVWCDDESWEHAPGATRYEFGEYNYAGRIGLAVATRYALGLGLDTIRGHVDLLASALRSALDDIPGVHTHDAGELLSGIVTFTIDGRGCDDVAASLREVGINVGSLERQYSRWDLGSRGLDNIVRVGVHYFNTENELDRLVDAVADLSGVGRSQS